MLFTGNPYKIKKRGQKTAPYKPPLWYHHPYASLEQREVSAKLTEGLWFK